MSSSGKSGCFFFMSPDRKYILKSVKQQEFDFFREIMESYYHYMTVNPDSLIIRFLGLYSIRFPQIDERGKRTNREVHLVCMTNIRPPGASVSETYDLKGSSTGRQATEEEKKDSSVILKDLDWKRKLHFGPIVRQRFLEQVSKDSRWLKQSRIMDYSLLLFISTSVLPSSGPPCGISFFEKDQGGIQATDDYDRPSNERYYFGVIDILQEYNLRKLVEHKLKSFAWHEDDVSCMDPERYSLRFETFLMRMV